MAFPLLGNSGHVVVSIFIDFLYSLKWHASLHHIAYDYSDADWGGHLRRISLNSVLLLVLVNFVSEFRLELIYISLIVNIRSSLTHLHCF